MGVTLGSTVTVNVNIGNAWKATNYSGTVSGLASGNTATVVSLTPGTNWKLRGFIAWGNSNALWQLEVDGSVLCKRRMNIASPFVEVALPEYVEPSSSVKLIVTNEGDTADFGGVILGFELQ